MLATSRSDGVLSVEPLAKRADRGSIKQKVMFSDRWSLGIVDGSPADIIAGRVPGRIEWLRGSSAVHFLADPFVVSFESELHVLCEQFDYLTATGKLIIGKVTDGVLSKSADLLDDGVHRSYPFPVFHDGKTYVVPEQSCLNSIQIYELVEGRDLVFRSTLVDDFAGVDPTIFKGSNHWWMFASDRADGPAGAALHLFFADDLLGQWQPHPLNPIVRGSQFSRPAGGLIQADDGSIWRPAQDCTTSYGSSITINRIDEMTVRSYRESPQSSIKMSGGPIAQGIHTINAFGASRSIVDGKSCPFNPIATVGRVLRRLA